MRTYLSLMVLVPKKINEVEKTLNINIGEEYCQFLSQYGMLMGYGVTILGCGKNGSSSVVTQTLRFRDFGLENEYIVICNADEWIDCLNLETKK